MDTNSKHNYSGSAAFKKILFFTDFSKDADRAFEYAIDFTLRAENAELFLLHVIPESESQFYKTYIYEVEDVDKKARSDIDERIEKSYISKLPDGVKINVEFRIGRDFEEILDFAKDKKIDLIVLARHSGSSLENAFFGNAAEKVVKRTHCAVLVVPGVEKDKYTY